MTYPTTAQLEIIRARGIPKRLRAEIALDQGGKCRCTDKCEEHLQPGFHIDHSPPLKMREWNNDAQDTIPRANDRRYMVGMVPEHHDKKTNGPRGPHTSIDSDKHAIAKMKRSSKMLVDKPALGEERPKSNWPSRPMGRRK